MQVFSVDELSLMQTYQEAAMQDTCVIEQYGETTDEYNNPNPFYTDSDALDCGLEHLNPREVHGTGQVPIIDARLRLPLDTEIDTRDRIRITYRFGVALTTPERYEIIGQPRRGPSGLVIDLKKHTGGQ